MSAAAVPSRVVQPVASNAANSGGRAVALSESDRVVIGQRMLRARIRLALQQPFLASALIRLPVREAHGVSWCATAATDGYHIFYNPQWVAGLKDPELRGLLAHEVLHVLFTHAERRNARDPLVWNIACDYAINGLLVQRGFRLPAGGLVSTWAEGKTSEQLYAELIRRMPPAGGKGGPRKSKSSGESDAAPRLPGSAPTGTADGDADPVPATGDDLLDPDDPRVRPLRSADAPDREQLDELRRELRQDALARLQGSEAGSFKQECDADARRRVDWRALLRAWLADRVKGDWCSFPFGKRLIHRGLFMPSPGLQVPSHVVFAIDTSGSMRTAELARIAGELQAFREVFPCRLSVIQCDTQVRSVDEYDAMDGYDIPDALQIKGRGGTDFRPVFRWVDEHAPGAVVLFATDGYGSFPEQPSASPTIWLHTDPHEGRVTFPFGAVVKVMG